MLQGHWPNMFTGVGMGGGAASMEVIQRRIKFRLKSLTVCYVRAVGLIFIWHSPIGLFLKFVCMKVMVPDGLMMVWSSLDSWSLTHQMAFSTVGNTRARSEWCTLVQMFCRMADWSLKLCCMSCSRSKEMSVVRPEGGSYKYFQYFFPKSGYRGCRCLE